MILEVTEEELNYLLDNKYLKPNGLSTCSDNYLIDVINYKGEKKEVSVAYRKSDTGSGLIHTDTSKSGQATLFPTNKQVSSTQSSNSDTDIKAVDVTLTDPDN